MADEGSERGGGMLAAHGCQTGVQIMIMLLDGSTCNVP